MSTNKPDKYIFRTKSGQLIQLRIVEEGVVAELDNIDTGLVEQSDEHGYSLKAKYSVKVDDRYINYTIVPQQKDIKGIRHFFLRSKERINKSMASKSEKIREKILKQNKKIADKK